MKLARYSLLMLLMLTSQNVLASDLEKGVTAYDAGNYQQAMAYWLPLAEKDHAEAQLFLGVLYRYGLGVDRDPARSAYWYERAANNGDIDAQNEIGLFYELGWGVRQDVWVAESWYEMVRDRDVCLSDTLATGRLLVEEAYQ